MVMRGWAKTLMALYGVRLDVRGLEYVDPNRPSIYMANHASPVDIIMLIVALPVDLRFIFKHSLLWFPFVGQAIYLMGMIPINRAAGPRAAASLNKAGNQIRKGKHFLIFPEGTRTRDGKLRTFKKGGFYLAIQQDIDIVPISINNSRALCGRNSILARKGTVEVTIHPRVPTLDYSLEKRTELITRIRETILSALKAPYQV